MSKSLDRREFAQRLGIALGATLVIPEAARAALPQHAPRSSDAGVIELDSNENPYGPSPAACDAIAACTGVACRYPDAAAHAMLQTVADFHQVPTNHVLLGCGSTEILRCADNAFVGPERTVVVAEPTYEAVLSFARVLHANAVQVPLDANHNTDLAAMARAVTPATGLVYLCNPNNPTATIVSQAALRSFLDAVPPATTVLVDEAYYHFVDDKSYGTCAGWTDRYPNLIVARTFSKIFGMAGMRLGYALAQPQTIAAMRTWQLMFDGNVAVLHAGAVSLPDDAHVAAMRQRFLDTKTWLYAELERDRRRYIPSHANFVMIDTGADVAPTIAAFRARKILVGRRFPSMSQWLRITVGKPEEMQAFMTALRQIVPTAAS